MGPRLFSRGKAAFVSRVLSKSSGAGCEHRRPLSCPSGVGARAFIRKPIILNPLRHASGGWCLTRTWPLAAKVARQLTLRRTSQGRRNDRARHKSGPLSAWGFLRRHAR